MLGFFNDALHSATHPSLTSNVGPTTSIFSRNIYVVQEETRAVWHEIHWCILVVVVNSKHDGVPLIIVCGGNGYLLVFYRMRCTSKESDYVSLYFGKHKA
jgi:hypothetical protein